MTSRASRAAILIGAAGFFTLSGLGGLLVLMAPATPAPFGPWQRVGQMLSAPADLDPVDFATLTRRPGDALVCPADLCAANQSAQSAPVFTISAERLTAKLRRVALAEWGLEALPAEGANQLRFVRRSALLRLPDVIEARIVARSSGAATLALSARPAVGLLDFGSNRRLLERWITALGD